MTRSDDYRKRNTLTCKRQGCLSRFAPVLVAMVVLAFLWSFPAQNQLEEQTSVAVSESFSKDVGFSNSKAVKQKESKSKAAKESKEVNERKKSQKKKIKAKKEKIVLINSSDEDANTLVIGEEEEVTEEVDSNTALKQAKKTKKEIIKSTEVGGVKERTASDDDIVEKSSVVIVEEPSSDTSEETENQKPADEHDRFSYQQWGYNSYREYLADHPFWARFNYARLWMAEFLKSAQPAGCSSCSRSVDDSKTSTELVAVARPLPGHVFSSVAQSPSPQLTIVAPDDKDVFIKLKAVDSGSTVLSFYVRAGYTVNACVPSQECSLYYALGNNWYGETGAFGNEGTYAVSDKTLDFSSLGNTYTYKFNVRGGNVTPTSVDRSVF